jgi:hypothetical protein
LHGIANFTTNDVPVMPLKITSMEAQPNSVKLTWDSNTGRVYSVQYSLDLSNWSELKTGIAASPGFSTTTVLDMTGASAGMGATLLQYRMGTANAQIQAATNLVAGGALIRGAGLNLWNLNYSNYSTPPVLTLNFTVAGPDLASAIANTNWFTFDLTVGSIVTDLDLTSLTFNAARGGAGTPRGYGVLVTTPTTTNEQVQGATDVLVVRPNWTNQIVNLSAVGSLQNLTAGQVVTFTIPCYSPAAGSSLEFDDVTVRGNIKPPPLPPYAGAKSLFLRVKE